MPDYVLLFRGGDLIHDRLSPSDMQAVMDRWRAWTRDLDARGLIRSGNPLAKTGRTVRPGPVVSDGPYAEAKELVGGYIVVSAPDYEAAAAIAARCPGLATGMTVEVREVRA